MKVEVKENREIILTLSLTYHEASVLMAIMSNISGDSENTPRGLADEIRDALEDRGITYPRCGLSGSIEVRDWSYFK